MTPTIQATAALAAPASEKAAIRRHSVRRSGKRREAARPGSRRRDAAVNTVFDRLYDEYLPFRLYADYMLGRSAASLAKEFDLPEHWVAERIEALRLCLGKQVRLNLLACAQ